jgi:predicted enzyme related to lactoylglutathione lyase
MWTGRAALAACLLALPVLVAACGSSSTAASASPSPAPAASTSGSPTAAITSAWQTFFSGATPAATKITLLQNGQQFATVIQAQAGSPLAKATQAKVTAVTVTSLDETLAKATGLGASIAFPKNPVPGVGWLAYIRDPDGNIVGLLEPDETAPAPDGAEA